MGKNPSVATPSHHPPAELLVDYVGGGGSDAETFMIGAHLALCPDCRRAVRDAEAIGGALLDAIEPVRLPPNLLNRTLAAIDADSGDEAPEATIGLPRALGRDLGIDPSAGPWRKLPRGIRARRLPVGSGAEQVALLKIPPGASILRHRHVGDEWTVVLQGGYSDRTGHFGKGDFVSMGAEDEHKPIAAAGEDCVCLVLLHGRPRYSGLIGLVARALIRS